MQKETIDSPTIPNTDTRSLDALSARRNRNRVQLSLEARLSLIINIESEIRSIIDHYKPLTAMKMIKDLVGTDIEEAVKDIVYVPEYCQKSGAKQIIYVFVGTFWEMAEIQVYYDFIREASRRTGLPDMYVNDEVFMNRLFENVAFRMARHMSEADPLGDVWINMLNGTLEIHADGSISMHDHCAEDNFRYCLPYAYDPKAECPLWHRFLDEVMPEKDLQTLLGEYIGYCLTRDLKLEKMAVFYGTGSNGKSVTMSIIKALAGKYNVSTSSLSSITTDPEVRAQLENKLINVSDESDQKLDTAVLKQMISGEPTDVRILWIGTHAMKNIPKFITSFNTLPPTENTYGYMRRWLLFPFNHTIPEGKQDFHLTDKLKRELPGILNWVLSLLRDMLKRINDGSGIGFSPSATCQKAVSDYMTSSNSALLFFAEACKVDDGAQMTLRAFYDEYKQYCFTNGITKPFQRKNFRKMMEDKGVPVTSYQHTTYFGVRVCREE